LLLLVGAAGAVLLLLVLLLLELRVVEGVYACAVMHVPQKTFTLLFLLQCLLSRLVASDRHMHVQMELGMDPDLTEICGVQASTKECLTKVTLFCC